ncbi:MAG TPA: TolC family protein, partial [Arenibacter sp.]|nr:TolC family protein [Arenibacter sp.]
MVKKTRVSTVMWFAIATMPVLYGQQQKDNTLGSLWSYVEEHYPGVGSKMSAIGAAKLKERAIKGNVLPELKAQAQNTYGTYEGSAGAFFPQAGFFNVNGSTVSWEGSSTAANTFGSAIIEWELFSFGKLRRQNEAAGTLYHKSVSEKDACLLDLKKTLSERYIVLLYSDAKLKWTERNAGRLDDIRKITSGLSASGLRPAADSLIASSSYMQAMGEYDKWKGFKDASFIKLLELYGKDAIDYSASSNRFNDPVENNLYGAHAISPLHPLLDVLDRQSEYYTLSGKAQQSASLPSVKLLGGYAYRGTAIGPDGSVSGAWKDGFNNTTNNFLVGVGITWNITNLHTDKLKGEAL